MTEFRGFYKDVATNEVFETSGTADTVDEAVKYFKEDLEPQYNLIRVEWENEEGMPEEKEI